MSFQHIIIISAVAVSGIGTFGALGNGMHDTVSGSTHGAAATPASAQPSPAALPQVTASKHAAASSAVRAISRAAKKLRNLAGQKTIKLPSVDGVGGADLALRVRPTDLTVTGPAGWRTFPNTSQTVSALDAHFGPSAKGRATKVAFSGPNEKPWVAFTTRLDHPDDILDLGPGRSVSHKFYEDGHEAKLLSKDGRVLTHFERYDAQGQFIAGSVRTSESGEMFSFWPAFDAEPDRLIVRASGSAVSHAFEGEHARFVRSLIDETETMHWDASGRFSGGYFLGDTDNRFTIHPDSSLSWDAETLLGNATSDRVVRTYTPEGQIRKWEFEPTAYGFNTHRKPIGGESGPRGFNANRDRRAGGIRITHMVSPDIDIVVKTGRGENINARQLGLALRRADNVTIESGIDGHSAPRIIITKDGRVSTFFGTANL